MQEYDSLKLDNQVCFSMYSALNAIVRTYKPYLKALDLTYPQYIIMMALWEQDKVSIKQITDKTHLDSGTLTPVLKRLEAKELLLRLQSPNDERARVITLTPKGKMLKDEATSVQGNMLCQIGLPMDDIHALKAGCDKLLNNLTHTIEHDNE